MRVFGGQDYGAGGSRRRPRRCACPMFKFAMAGASPGAIVQVVIAIAIGAIITITAHRAAAAP